MVNKIWKNASTIIGWLIFSGMFLEYVHVKEFPTWLFIFPGFLVGIEPTKIIALIVNRKEK